MIRAVIKQGTIQPIDPLPVEWEEGREVIVEESASESNESDREQRFQEFLNLPWFEYEPGEREYLDQLMKEADESAKACVRREMGLPE